MSEQLTTILPNLGQTLGQFWQVFVTEFPRLAPHFLAAICLAVALTPLVGKLARKVGALDLPAHLRSRLDRTASRRVHERVTPKFGGLAMALALMITLACNQSLGYMRWGVVAGIIIITVVGILDDIYELSGKAQLFGQILAATMVVFSGITMTGINVAGVSLGFNQWSSLIEIGNFVYNFIFPADIITILWIVGLINVINWVGGIDGLNGAVSFVVAATMLLIAINAHDLPLAIVIATYLGSVLGVLIFNYPPAHIFFGSAGDFLNGFLIAVFSILQLSKMTTAIVILGLPLLDAVWVLLARLKANPGLLKKPWAILEVSDKNHFHHRLLAAGFSVKNVLFIELAITLALCALALSFTNIDTQYTAFLSALIAVAAIFIFLTASIKYIKRRQDLKRERETRKPQVEVKILNPDDQPEKRYAY